MKSNLLTIYPNPSNGNMTFELDQSDFKKGEIIIYSNIGQEMDRFSVNKNQTNYSFRNDMNSGINHVILYLDVDLTEKANIVVK